jgi:hypothetical protein
MFELSITGINRIRFSFKIYSLVQAKFALITCKTFSIVSLGSTFMKGRFFAEVNSYKFVLSSSNDMKILLCNNQNEDGDEFLHGRYHYTLSSSSVLGFHSLSFNFISPFVVSWLISRRVFMVINSLSFIFLWLTLHKENTTLSEN